MQELDKARQQFGHEMDKMMAETEARVRSMNPMYEIMVAQLLLELEQAKQENLSLQALHNEREDSINMLVMRQR